MKKATLQLETLTCPSCMAKIEGLLKGIDGVDGEKAKVLFNASKAKFEFDEEKVSVEEISEKINNLGYDVLESKVN